MKPDLEVVQIGRGQSFTAWEHGYPYHTVRWHFHPECEIHYVVATAGRYFIGDFIGEFAPGNLVMTGPNLPHNWVSHVAPETPVPLRSRVVQFPEIFLSDIADVFGELSCFQPVLEISRRGALFSAETASRAAPLLEELVKARGIRRVELFVGLLAALAADRQVQPLTSAEYHPDPSGFMSTGVNQALSFINANLTEPFSENDLAESAGLSAGTFSRSFRRHTGMGVVQYVNRLRINLACQLLMNARDMSVTEICYAAGFNNLSNFNRQFLKQKGIPPSRFRLLLGENVAAA